MQNRNIAALEEPLALYRGKTFAAGMHGMALSLIVNHYDNTYGYEDFSATRDIMPWVVVMSFDGKNCVEVEKIDLFA